MTSLDEVTGIFHVASRNRYVSFKELLELRDPLSTQCSKYFAEFSNEDITALLRTKGRGNTSSCSEPYLMDIEVFHDESPAETLQESASVSYVEGVNTDSQSSASTPASEVSSALKSFGKRKGSLDDLSLGKHSKSAVPCSLDDLVTYDQRFSMTLPDLELSTIQFRVPKRPSPRNPLRIDEDGIIWGNYTNHSTATTEEYCFAKCLDEPSGFKNVNTEEAILTSGKGTNKPTIENQEHHDINTITSAPASPSLSRVQDLPSFSIWTNWISEYCDALNLAQKPCLSTSRSPLSHLDLAQPAKGKGLAVPYGRHSSASADNSLGEDPIELELSDEMSVASDDGWISNDDDDDRETGLEPEISPSNLIDPSCGLGIPVSESEIPTVLNVTAWPVFEPPASGQTSSSLGLRPHFSKATTIIIDEVHDDYCQTWAQAHPDTLNHLATYDGMAAQLAFQNFEMKHGTMQADTVQVIKDSLAAFLVIWRAGNPKRQWFWNIDDRKLVTDLAIKAVEWSYMVCNSNRMRDTVRLQPGSMVLGESSSSSDWYLQAIGGDDLYPEYRHVQIEENIAPQDKVEDRPIHHINFNGHAVYQRCYTPPEVSFWAASTTYKKVILNKDLPNVHYAKVIAGQAFKWVDPTEYLGDNINELWNLQGSAMRNAATSDIQVVYPNFGTWTQDVYTEDESIPAFVPTDNKYEYAMNGDYHYFQVPYLFSRLDDENFMFDINEGKPSKFRHCRSRPFRKQKRKLSDELGAELAKKAALLKDKLEISRNPENLTTPMETVVEETLDTEENPIIDTEGVSEASTETHGSLAVAQDPVESSNSDDEISTVEGPDTKGGESSFNPKTPPEPEDIDVEAEMKEGLAKIERKRVSYRCRVARSHTEDGDDDEPISDDEPESFDGENGITDHSSIWPSQPQAAEHPQAELLASFADDCKGKGKTTEESSFKFGQPSRSSELQSDAQSQAVILQGGRPFSPSKMVLSRINEVRTPVQSPADDQNFGSWELNNLGSWETPGAAAAPRAVQGLSPENVLTPSSWDHVPSQTPLEDPFVDDSNTETGDNYFTLVLRKSSARIQAAPSLEFAVNVPRPELLLTVLPVPLMREIQTRILQPQVSRSASISEVVETDLDINTQTSSEPSKALVLHQKPRLPTLKRSLGHARRSSIEAVWNLPDLTRRATIARTIHALANENRTHSRSSSSASELSTFSSSNFHSRSSSLSAPWPDSEIQEELSLPESKAPTTSGNAITIDHVRAEVSLARQPASFRNAHASNNAWAGAGEMKWENASGMFNQRAADAAKEGNLRIRPVPSTASSQPTATGAANVESEPLDDIEDLAIPIFAPLGAAAVGFIAWKVGKVFWKGLWA